MTINKFLRWAIYGGLFAITLTPLIVTPSSSISLSLFFPFITGKNYFFRLVVEIIFGLWLILAYRDETARPKQSGILWALTAYLAVMVIATAWSEYPARSFWSNFERMEGLLAYIHSYLFFLVAVSVLKTKQLWRRLWQTSLGVSLLVSWHGLLQLAGKAEIHQSGSRLDASLGNSAYLAVYMLFHIFMAGYLLATTKNKLMRYAYGAIIVLESVILYYTATRGAILGAIGGAILVAIILAIKNSGQTRKIALSGLSLVVLLVVIFFAVRNTTFVKNNQVLSRFAGLSLNDSSLLAREQIWGMSLRGIKEHPVLGWGPENYPFIFQKYYTPQMYGQEPWFDRSHNIVLDNMVSAGVLGLIAYLAIFAVAVYFIWKREENESWAVKAILLGLLAGYFFQNLTVFDQLISIIMFYLVLGFLHTGATENSPAAVRVKNAEGGAWLPFVVLGAAVLSIGSIYYFNLRGITVSATLIKAISQKDPAQAIGYFDQIFKYQNVTGLTEAREQLLNAAGNVVRAEGSNAQLKQQYTALATAQMAKQFAENNNDAREHLFYGTFLQGIGDTKAAIAELEKARELSPAKQMILFQLGAIYIGSGEVDRGLNYFKQAYEEDPSFPEARRLYALAALYAKNKPLSDRILGADRAMLVNDDRFLNYYAETKQYDQVLEIWKARQLVSPNDKQTNISLAATYYFLGDRAMAIKVLKDFIARDPSFAKEGDDLIKQIELGRAR
jgi:O-antigen ligase